MDYKKFRLLVKEGEKSNVDFKLESHAFNTNAQGPNAELAKDICAMSNNGNMSSYLIIGVSDDTKSFRSVENPNLTDENIQSFCKTAIFPPPKIKIHRKKWSRGTLAEHKEIEFVVIQIGPHAKQAFHLARDFIAYKEKICYRKNTVWIRRGTTTDIATPEEISELYLRKGKTGEYKSNISVSADRAIFKNLSLIEKVKGVSQEARSVLKQDLGFSVVQKKDWRKVEFSYRVTGTIDIPLLYKQKNSQLILLSLFPCLEKLSRKDIDFFLYRRDYFPYKYATKNKFLSSLGDTQLDSLRRVTVIPLLGPFLTTYMESNFPKSKRIGNYKHFYLPELELPSKWKKIDTSTLLPSSSELLVLDGIKSYPEFKDNLKEAIIFSETKDTVVKLGF